MSTAPAPLHSPQRGTDWRADTYADQNPFKERQYSTKETLHTSNKETYLENGKHKTLKWWIVLNKLKEILQYIAFSYIKLFDQISNSKHQHI